jgi:Matrixin
MSDAPPPLAPPSPGVPPRPDRRQPEHPSLVLAFVVLLVIATVLSSLAVMSILRDPADLGAPASSASTSTSATPSPSPSPVWRKRIDGAFKFLDTEGEAPIRWNPCGSITYAVNTAGAGGRRVLRDLDVALERVTRATGISFVPAGTSRESFEGAYRRMRYGRFGRKAELIVIWVDHDDYRDITRHLRGLHSSIAFAKTMAGLYANRDEYFGGIIVMDSDANPFLGFSYRYAHGTVLLHELGHIMGLAHVKDRDQVMYRGSDPNYSVDDFGPGDREGLRRLGHEAGCLT